MKIKGSEEVWLKIHRWFSYVSCHLLDIERPGSRKLGDLLILSQAEHTAHLR
jgi:hypothetical protein